MTPFLTLLFASVAYEFDDGAEKCWTFALSRRELRCDVTFEQMGDSMCPEEPLFALPDDSMSRNVTPMAASLVNGWLL
ncbi:hypothetical protein MY10362_002691 [Beauveria mimosiformis]